MMVTSLTMYTQFYCGKANLVLMSYVVLLLVVGPVVYLASIRMILPIQEMGSGDYMFIALSDGFVEYR